MLFRAATGRQQVWSGRSLLGSMLAGWGVFNFIEGLVDHQLLGIHHVLPGHPNQLLFDMLFLGSGVVLAAIGASLARSGQRQTEDAQHQVATG
jgi:uncharacterized membrane protein